MSDASPGRQIVSANRLADGLVVFRTAAGAWTEVLAEAKVFTPAEAELDVARATAAEATIVVGAYAVDVGDGGVTPVRLRERIRALGPTVAYGAAAVPAGFRRAVGE